MSALLWFSFMWNSIAQAENPFRVEILPATTFMEQLGVIQVVFIVPEGHHLYVDMLSVQPEPSTDFAFEPAKYPMGKLKADPASPEQMREIYPETTTVTIPLKAKSSGIHLAKIEVRYQGCKEGLCYMPKSEIIETSVIVNK